MKIFFLEATCLIGKISMVGSADMHACTPLGFMIGLLIMVLTVLCAFHRAHATASWLLAPPLDPSLELNRLIDASEQQRKEDIAAREYVRLVERPAVALH